MEESRANQRLALRLVSAGFALYCLWRFVQAYLAGGPDAPSLWALVFTAIVLVGGSVLVIIMAVREWKKTKAEIQEKLEAEQAAEADDGEEEPDEEPEENENEE